MKTIFVVLLFLSSFARADFKRFNFENPPQIGVTKAGQKVFAGGISAMHVVSQDSPFIEVLVLSDRGPNAKKKGNLRPFALPDYQPRLLRLRLDKSDHQVKQIEQIILRDSRKVAFSGLPPFKPGTSTRGEVETPVDLFGNTLATQPLGIDPEGLCIAPDKSIWVSDEYGPDIFHFDKTGILIERLSPGAGLPEWVTLRSMNNGFEGLACDGAKVFALLQAPLRYPNARNEISVRLLEIDTTSKKTTAVYLYKLGSKGLKLGDLSSNGDRKFLAIEQNGETGAKGVRDIYEIDLNGATNLLSEPKTIPEKMGEDALASKVKAVKKTKILNLAHAGFDVEKAESVALLASGELLVASDNDFGLEGEADFKTGTVPISLNKKTQFGLFNIKSDAKGGP